MPISITQIPDPVNTSLNEIVARAQATVGWEVLTSYYLRMAITVETEYESGTFDAEINLDQTPDPVTGEVIWNCQHVLHAFPQPDKLITIASSGAQKLTGVVKRISYSFNELSGGEEIGTPVPGGNIYLYRGGFDYITGQALQDWFEDGKFLSQQPRTRYVRRRQPEFLTLIIPAGIIQARLAYEMTLSDNSTVLEYGPPFDCVAYNAILFPSGHEQLGMAAQPLPVKSWRAWVVDTALSPISEEQTYIVQEFPCSPLERYYLFENSLGGWDTLATTGELEVQMQVSKFEAQHVPSPIADRELPVFQHYGRKYRNQYRQRTGYMTASQLEASKDILLSEAVYRIGDYYPDQELVKGQVFWPVNVSPGSTVVHEDNNFLKAFEFTALDAHESRGVRGQL